MGMVVAGAILARGTLPRYLPFPTSQDREEATLFPDPLLYSVWIMVQKKRVAITTAIGILTGMYCAGSLLVLAPRMSHRNPGSWS